MSLGANCVCVGREVHHGNMMLLTLYGGLA